MLTLTSEQSEALAQRRVMLRHFVYIVARDPDTGDPSPAGFHNDVGVIENAGRTYYGSSLFSISDQDSDAELGVASMTVTLSGLSDEAVALIRGETVGQAPIEILLGIMDPDSHALIGPLIRRFKGFVDRFPIRTKVGDKTTIDLICESSARALTIKRTGTRSAQTHAERAPADKFFEYTASQREQTIYFGRRDPNASQSGRNGRPGR